MILAPARLALLTLLCLAQGFPAAQEPPAPPADLEFFEKEVRPVLAGRCQECHGARQQKGGLRLDSRTAALEGGELGPAIVPGRPEESLLVEAIRHGETLQMPPRTRLPEPEVAVLVRWVALGAPWAPEVERPGLASAPGAVRMEVSNHWSFQPIRPVAVPEVRDALWPLTPIDRFLAARLDAAGLTPAADAEPATWLRRASLDLTGLPPTPREIRDFLADHSPDARERQVDRLLASPHYGERLARLWLDLVRYGDTYGHEFDYEIPNAWRYRDYLVRAFNADLPFDRLVIEHLAGDLIPLPRLHPADGTNESVLATGFHFLGEGTHSPVDAREEQVRRIDNQIDVIGKTFLGLTVACARCHDHKFDPISQRDYYGLAGYLKSSRHQQAFRDGPPAVIAELTTLRDRIAAAIDGTDPPISNGPPAIDDSTAHRFEAFDGPSFAPWTVTGPAFGAGPTDDCSIRVESSGAPERVVRLAAGWAHSGLISDRLQGVLRSPSFTIDRRWIHVRAFGRGGRVNLVLDGFEKIRDPIYGGLTVVIDSPDTARWYSIDLGLWPGHRAYLEFADGAVADFSGSQSRLVPGDGFIAIDEVRFTDTPTPDEGGPAELARIAADTPAIGSLIEQYRDLEALIEDPEFAPAILDGTGEDEWFLPRGNHRAPGDAVPRRFLAVLSGAEQADPGSGSGRLELARRVIDAQANPLTPRVIVNRLWQRHFGRGLAATPDDFGRMGQPPTHPELLDWLAGSFLRDGQSIKRLERMIVLSRAYGISSRPVASAEAADPENRLLHRMPLRRLDAESVRDALLVSSGRLDRRLHGPGVPPFLDAHMEGRGRPSRSGPLDGDGRRTLYLQVRRNFLSPFLLAFDFPAPASPMGRRHVTNVPAQALALLNDPFVRDQAGLCARRCLASCEPLADDRLEDLVLAIFGRPPTVVERERLLAFLAANSVQDESQAWSDLVHALYNAKAFLYIE